MLRAGRRPLRDYVTNRFFSRSPAPLWKEDFNWPLLPRDHSNLLQKSPTQQLPVAPACLSQSLSSVLGVVFLEGFFLIKKKFSQPIYKNTRWVRELTPACLACQTGTRAAAPPRPAHKSGALTLNATSGPCEKQESQFSLWDPFAHR